MKTKALLLVFLFGLFPLVHAHIGALPESDGNKPFIVVLDAGHGGHDPGNLGNGYLEKNIALNIVLQAGAILEKNPNIKVIYTRKDDTFVNLYKRGEIANKANADLFVSVHCDSHTSDAHGAGTFVLGLHANKQNFEIAKKENSVIYLEDNYETRYADYDINSPESVIGLTIMQEEFLDQSIALAKMIQDNFSGKLKRNDRKVKQAGFIVLHQTFMPSVLVECGFLTNKQEGAYLNSAKGQAEMATAIADAIKKYHQSVAPTEATPVAENAPPSKQEPEKDKAPKMPTEEVVEVVEKVKANVPEEKGAKETPVEDEKGKIAAVVVQQKQSPAGEAASVVPEDYTFKVQLLASSRDLSLVPNNFNGLGNISKEPYKNMFRYLYGETKSYKAAEKLKASAALKGYTTAYIVAYKEGNRVPVPEALK
ncbi:N-acetylmuramoyl-L-alanine amidase [Maribacter sp. 2307ULW6-5]|uniref:N-acetylmuramoyl-L-alanine amidase n=1 Tax=Maribacter sp. 2307ULW6-5 TaxID=3386275 RepID=UPI0039BD0F12